MFSRSSEYVLFLPSPLLDYKLNPRLSSSIMSQSQQTDILSSSAYNAELESLDYLIPSNEIPTLSGSQYTLDKIDAPSLRSEVSSLSNPLQYPPLLHKSDRTERRLSFFTIQWFIVISSNGGCRLIMDLALKLINLVGIHTAVMIASGVLFIRSLIAQMARQRLCVNGTIEFSSILTHYA